VVGYLFQDFQDLCHYHLVGFRSGSPVPLLFNRGRRRNHAADVSRLTCLFTHVPAWGIGSINNAAQTCAPGAPHRCTCCPRALVVDNLSPRAPGLPQDFCPVRSVTGWGAKEWVIQTLAGARSVQMAGRVRIRSRNHVTVLVRQLCWGKQQDVVEWSCDRVVDGGLGPPGARFAGAWQ
jgi:hypothetical protein